MFCWSVELLSAFVRRVSVTAAVTADHDVSSFGFNREIFTRVITDDVNARTNGRRSHRSRRTARTELEAALDAAGTTTPK